jgi:Phage tail tube protein
MAAGITSSHQAATTCRATPSRWHAQGAGILSPQRSQAQLDRAGVHSIRPGGRDHQRHRQGETRFGTTQGGTPTSLTFSRISQFQGSIKRAGNPVGNLTGGSVADSNNLEKIETIRDDGLIEGADPTIAALTGRIDVRFADTTLIDLAADGTPVDLEFALHLSAQAKLVLPAHEVYLPKPKLAVEGPGGVQASFDFRGAKNDVAGRMLTVTLTNDLDGTVYA